MRYERHAVPSRRHLEIRGVDQIHFYSALPSLVSRSKYYCVSYAKQEWRVAAQVFAHLPDIVNVSRTGSVWGVVFKEMHTHALESVINTPSHKDSAGC